MFWDNKVNLENTANLQQQPLRGRYLKFWGRGENLTWGDLAFDGATWEPFKNHGLFFVFLVAGLVELGENPWTCRMSQILKKRCNPKMVSRHGKHLLTAKSKAENFGLLALYPCYFFYLLFGCSMVNFWLFLRKQSHSLDVNHRIWAINFWSKGDSEGLGLYSWVSSELWSQWNDPLTHSPQIAKTTLPRLAPTFSKMWKSLQYRKQL